MLGTNIHYLTFGFIAYKEKKKVFKQQTRRNGRHDGFLKALSLKVDMGFELPDVQKLLWDLQIL